MNEFLNTLYATVQGSVLRLESNSVRVTEKGKTLAKIPLIRLGGIVVFGRVTVTPHLIARCAADGRGLVWMDPIGRFVARAEGHLRGNVLLRRAQHLALSDPDATCRIARQIVAAKIQNARDQALRSARDSRRADEASALRVAASDMADALVRLRSARDLDAVRGQEGFAASAYFGAFNVMLRNGTTFGGRTRRPPRDPVNAVLSFIYSLLASEYAGAAEGVGLDPQVGYLHALRPGRPALALDLMEETRSPVADRLAITLFNRGQLRDSDFEQLPGGAVHMRPSGRKKVITAYQRRKEVAVAHRVLKRKVPLGIVPHIQARLLARHLRQDLKDYPPFRMSA